MLGNITKLCLFAFFCFSIFCIISCSKDNLGGKVIEDKLKLSFSSSLVIFEISVWFFSIFACRGGIANLKTSHRLPKK